MLDLNQSYRQIAVISLDRAAPRCIVAAHAAGQRSAHEAHYRARAFICPADGGASAGERHSQPQGPAEARPQGRPPADRRAAAEPTRVPRDSEGVRSPACGAEVRACEGEQDPDAVQDLALEDGRWLVRAPAA